LIDVSVEGLGADYSSDDAAAWVINELKLELTLVIRLGCEFPIQRHARVRLIGCPNNIETSGGNGGGIDPWGRMRGSTKGKRYGASRREDPCPLHQSDIRILPFSGSGADFTGTRGWPDWSPGLIAAPR
jgi:hypothetical protein